MGKRVVIILFVVLILAGAAAYHLYSRQPTYTSYGIEVITTTASSNELAAILHQTAWELGDCIIREDGGRHLPSFHQSGRSWTDDASKIIAIRTITEFDDKDANHSVIETVDIPGRPTLILLKSGSESSTTELSNHLLRKFHASKIKRKE